MDWVNELTHESLTTPEAKTALSKYDSQEAALVGGLNAMKTAGAPFRLPESLDQSHINDEMRAEFTSRVGKLLGVPNEDALNDVNFADGLPNADMVNADLVSTFKKFAVENHLSKSVVAKLVKMNNQFSVSSRTAQDQASADAHAESVKTVNTAMEASHGGKDGVAKHVELVKRLFKNHSGLSGVEFDSIAEGLTKGPFATDPAMRKALYNLAAAVVPEAVTGSQEQVAAKKTASSSIPTRFPTLAKHLNWKTS